MRLILVRHGESARNRGYQVSDEDNNLTIKGIHQAVELAKKLKDEKITAIYCSPGPRCRQTMEEILRVRDDDIRIILSWLAGPKIKKESFDELERRMIRFVDDLKYDHQPNDVILVVSHQLPLGMMTLVIDGEIKKFENGELFEVIL